MKLKVNILILFLALFFSCDNIENKNKLTKKTFEISVNKNTIYSILVLKDDELVLEKYYNGKNIKDLVNIQSLTKGIMSILIGIAIDEKFIKNEEETIEKYFPKEFEKITDNRKKNITIKDLLNQTSGLSWKGYLEHDSWMKNQNPNLFVLQKKLEHNPGEIYNYNSGATHLLSEIIHKSTGKTTLEFARKYLFNPLDIKTLNWEKRNDGNYDGSGFGLEMKPKDLILIGQLLANKGYHKKKQLISKKWINTMFDKNLKSVTKWGLRNSTHGYCWYNTKLNDDEINYGMGYGGQFIILIPTKNLVIVATHNHDTPKGIEQQTKFLIKELPLIIKKFE